MSLHVIAEGDGPSVLFLHAGVADSRMWRDQMGMDGYQTVAYDKRGFGDSAWVAGEYSDTEDAIGILDDLGIDSAVIVGCSMGASTAIRLALEHPRGVKGLVLVGGFPSGWAPDSGWEENPLEGEAVAAQEAGDLERVVDIDHQMWLVGYGRSNDDVDPSLEALFRDMDRIPVATAAERETYQRGFEYPVDDRLEEIDIPTLVIVGEHDEKLLVDAADYLARRLSDQGAVIIDNAAHLPSLEQPEAFNDALTGFLGSI